MTEVSKEKALYDAFYQQRPYGNFVGQFVGTHCATLDGDFDLDEVISNYEKIMAGTLVINNSDYVEPSK